ncbi:hypothetical protein OUZ56_010936 [Daphnia magna]|uniref:Uncharacterized protein n=1 Tax=Daphnia magna TaxID=35525 RepID=A0ABQ9YYT4_9CRUS|nr:hypothetical protein OUZ56_010936 [Daphnia magna]
MGLIITDRRQRLSHRKAGLLVTRVPDMYSSTCRVVAGSTRTRVLPDNTNLLSLNHQLDYVSPKEKPSRKYSILHKKEI